MGWIALKFHGLDSPQVSRAGQHLVLWAGQPLAYGLDSHHILPDLKYFWFKQF